MTSVRPAGCVSIGSKDFNVAIFSDTINMINVKLGSTVVLIDLLPFIPFLVTLTVFQVKT